MEEATLPNYVATKGIPVADSGQQKPIMKMLNRMMAKRLKMPRAKVSQQSVKIKQKKIKYY